LVEAFEKTDVKTLASLGRKSIDWILVRREEAAVFAVGPKAHFTGSLDGRTTTLIGLCEGRFLR
jgi:hypothetical protein